MSKRLKSNFTFGGVMAEADPLLYESYYDNGDYAAIASPDDPRCFIIGRTGSGKSAAFQQLDREFPGKVVRIRPENLSLPYISNLDVTQKLADLGVHLEPLFVALWKHVFIVEIVKHRYGIADREKKQNIVQNLKERFRRDPTNIRAIEYLDEFGDRFWCDADERVKQIADRFQQKIKAAGDLNVKVAGVGTKAAGGVDQENAQEIQREIVAKYQRIVNGTQIPRLNQMIEILGDEILESHQHFTYLVIDDLDKEWVDERLHNLLIKCLFQAAIDLQSVKHLKILVALRTNIFHQFNFGEQSRGGQEEKFRGMALNIRWTEGDLRGLLAGRAQAASGFYKLDPPKKLSEMLPRTNKSAGDPLQYILSRTLMRPRDVILYLNACIREATGKAQISWNDIRQAEKPYSDERLLALRDEWKEPFFDIDKIFELFRGRPARMDRQQFTEVLDEVALLLADERFRGTPWLTWMCEVIWAPGSGQRSWDRMYGPLLNLLYDISFIGLCKGSGGPTTYSYQHTARAQAVGVLPANTMFEIHPAFRRALDIEEQQARLAS